MTEVRRALQAATDLIKAETIQASPVNVRGIAAKRAHILERALDDSLSGMLVPLTPAIAGKAWAIVVNKKHPEVRKRFTIAHELGHLLLHSFTAPHADTQFRIRLRNSSSSTSQDIEEIQANRFAAELLMPEHLVKAHLEHAHIEYAPEDRADESLDRLARKFGVSSQALSIRLAHLFG
jgi:hypothetical protein